MADKLDASTRKRVSRAGGLARSKKLSPKRRAEIARAAAEARWGDIPHSSPKRSLITRPAG